MGWSGVERRRGGAQNKRGVRKEEGKNEGAGHKAAATVSTQPTSNQQHTHMCRKGTTPHAQFE